MCLPESACWCGDLDHLVVDVVDVVDVFGGRWSGLVLVEVEVADLDATLFLPSWVGRDVSSEDAFSGGVLAATPLDQVAEVLAQAQAGGSVQA